MKSKFIRIFTLVLFLTIILLLSSFVGINVLAKSNNPNKPDKPEKPEPIPDLVEADFKIWIGNIILNPPEDVVLQPYGDPQVDYLFVGDHVGGFWLPRPTKGKPSLEGWDISFGRVNLVPGEEPEYCGIYDINDQSLFDTLELHETFDFDNQDVHAICIQHLYLPHDTPIRPNPPEADFWDITIVWDVGTWGVPNPYPPPEEIPRHLLLYGMTNPNSVKEGGYNEDLDAWTITFDTIFELLENAAEPEGPDTGPTYNKLWEGPLSFTVKIQRTLP